MPERVTEASTVDLADLRIDARLLTPATRQALRAPRSIRLKQAFDLLFELGCLGYNTKDFTSTRKRNEPTGARWEKESLPSYEISARIALDYFGDVPILGIPEADVTAYIEHVKRIPARHGKTYRLDLFKGYRALIRGADLAEILRTGSTAEHPMVDPAMERARQLWEAINTFRHHQQMAFDYSLAFAFCRRQSFI